MKARISKLVNSVTIMGQSSGAASVTYLMASPLAEGIDFDFKNKGYFNRSLI